MNCCGTKYPANTLSCPECGRISLFDHAAISQDRWSQGVDSVSSSGLYYFTQSQLFAEFLDEKTDSTDVFRITLLLFILAFLPMSFLGVCVALILSVGLFFLSPERHNIGIAVMFTVFFLFGLYFSIGFWGFLGIPLLVMGTMCLWHTPQQMLSFAEFQRLSQVWFQVYPNDKALLGSSCVSNRIPLGVQGLLLVDQDILVDFFVHNSFVLKSNIAVFSSRFISDLPNSDVPIYFLHGSGPHVAPILSSRSVIDIGWVEEDLHEHPSFREFLKRDLLPVDLLSPQELLEATRFAVQKKRSILCYFDT